MERAVLLAAVALGGHDGAVTSGQGALDEEDVGFLAGLEDSELGVDRSVLGHDPVGSRLGAAGTFFDGTPGGPALTLVGVVNSLERQRPGRGRRHERNSRRGRQGRRK